MNALRKIPFYLPLLALFFCLHGSNENYGAVYFREIFLCGLSVLIAILFIFGVIFLCCKRKVSPAALITFFIAAWFFFFGAFHDFVRAVPFLFFLKKYFVIVPFLLLATVAWSIFIFKKPTLCPKLTAFFNLLLVIYCMVDLTEILLKAASAKTPIQRIDFNYAAVKQKPDVFLLVFDEYPGLQSLQDSFNFQNRQLYDFLSADSFHVIPSSSNYNLTEFSMPSFFNMDYIARPYPTGDIPQKVFEQRHEEINRGAAFSIFKNMGYRIENNSIFDVDDKPGLFDRNSFILGHNSLLTDKIFLNRFNKEAGTSLPDVIKKNVPFITGIVIETHRENNQKVERATIALAASPPEKKPLFAYCHFLLPHDPYFFDSSGNQLPKNVYDSPGQENNRGQFISYLKYCNTVLKKTVTAIHTRKPGAIIILMSDHGYRHYIKDNREKFQQAHFNNIFAVRFPDSNYGKADSLSNVNFLRYIFNTQFGQQFTYLPDSTINLF